MRQDGRSQAVAYVSMGACQIIHLFFYLNILNWVIVKLIFLY